MTDSREAAALVTERLGLGGIGAALRERSCRIAFLGASVSAQKNGYASELVRRLSEQTGHDHALVQASIGGLGCLSGVFLMDGLLAARRPDLCFVEFSTADRAGYTPLDRIGAAAEGILRKLIAQSVQPVILHLYRRESATFPSVAAEWERVAEHYGVPTIDLESSWSAAAPTDLDPCLRDAVHVTETGAERLGRDVSKAVLGLSPGPGALWPSWKMHADAYDRTCIVPATREMLDNSANARARMFRFNYPYIEVGPGHAFRYANAAGIVGLLLIVGPAAGTIRIEDERGARRLQAFDEYCHYDRLQTLLVLRETWEPRRVMCELTQDPVDISACRRPVALLAPADRRFALAGFLTRG